MNISDFTLHRFLTCWSQHEIQNEISKCKISKLELSRYIARSYKTTLAVITQPLSFHYVLTFLQYKTPPFRIHVFRTRRLIHTSWLQNLNFKFGALRHEKGRGLAFYAGASCLIIYLLLVLYWSSRFTRFFQKKSHSHLTVYPAFPGFFNLWEIPGNLAWKPGCSLGFPVYGVDVRLCDSLIVAHTQMPDAVILHLVSAWLMLATYWIVQFQLFW